MYITIDDYSNLYNPIDAKAFNRLALDACRMIDDHTTGVDGVKKLKWAFPTDADDAAAVKNCAAKLVNMLYRLEEAEKMAGVEATDQGIRGKLVSSVSAGNESISYSTGPASVIEKAVSDPAAREILLSDTIRESLTGARDAYGVNLLYMGPYPRRYLC